MSMRVNTRDCNISPSFIFFDIMTLAHYLLLDAAEIAALRRRFASALGVPCRSRLQMIDYMPRDNTGTAALGAH